MVAQTVPSCVGNAVVYDNNFLVWPWPLGDGQTIAIQKAYTLGSTRLSLERLLIYSCHFRSDVVRCPSSFAVRLKLGKELAVTNDLTDGGSPCLWIVEGQ